MPCTFLSDSLNSELVDRLSQVRYVFTDLDGTMLGPGSCVLRTADGELSLDFVSTLLDLQRAGIEVIPCSGRNRAMLHEDTRVLGLNSYIGEMGGLLMLDRSHDVWEYYTADMPFDPSEGITPHQAIEQTGVLDSFCGRWPGLLEFHNDMASGYKYREVTVGMRGEVSDEEAREIIRQAHAQVEWADNGHLSYISAPTTLELPEGVRGRAFNIMPQGLHKGRGIARFCALRNIDPAQTLSIGDAPSDFYMADATATFVLVENGLSHEGAREFLNTHEHAFVTPGRAVDGWVAAMRCILAAQA